MLKAVSFSGGSAGIFAAAFFSGLLAKNAKKSKFRQKAKKENMMLWVFVSCFLVIQMVAYLMLKGFHQKPVTFAFGEFFQNFRVVPIYLFAVNVITAILFGIDKKNAVSGRLRIRITTLLGFSFVGGAVGGLIAMYTFRHKTRQDYFAVGLPLMVVMHIVVIFYFMNMG